MQVNNSYINPVNRFIKDEFKKVDPSDVESVKKLFEEIEKRVNKLADKIDDKNEKKTLSESSNKELLQLYCSYEKRASRLMKKLPKSERKNIKEKTMDIAVDIISIVECNSSRLSLLQLSRSLPLENPSLERRFFKKVLRAQVTAIGQLPSFGTAIYALKKGKKIVAILYPILHFASEKALMLPQKVLDFIKRSSVFCQELDAESVPKIQSEVALLRQREINPEKWALYSEAILEIMKKRSEKKQSALPQLSLPFMFDASLCTYANSLGKKIINLEDIPTQVKAVIRVEKNKVNQPPILDVSGYMSEEESALTLVDAWLRGDFNGLPECDVELMNNRNKEMARKIDNLITKKHQFPFVAIGILHFPGKLGLLSLLKDKGYTIRQINENSPCNLGDLIAMDKLMTVTTTREEIERVATKEWLENVGNQVD